MLWKLLFTIAIVVLVWMVFKKAALSKRDGVGGPSRVDRVRQAAEDAVRARTGQPPRAEEVKTVSLIECPSCGNYVAPGTACNCGWKAKD